MNGITKYSWIGYTAVRSNLAYVGEVISRTIFMAVILYIFMRLWTVVYAGNGTERLGGLTLPEMIWYLMLTESMFLSNVRVSMEVDEDVRTGRLAVQLLRPASYGVARFAQSAGERLVRLASSIVTGSLVAFVLVGPIRFSARGVAIFLLMLPMVFVIDFLGYFGVGLCAFWLESTAGLTLIYMRVSMLLGGTLLPLDVFPAALQPIMRALPFASTAYGPARLFIGGEAGLLQRTLLTQFEAVALFGGIVWLIQRSALKRIQSHGG